MDTKLNIFMKILNILSRNPQKCYDLEDLTSFVMPCLTEAHQQNLWIQRGYQAEVLDALILLDNHGFIILNPVSDQSIISIKGLISVSSTTFSN
jgi:hypothetical protein